MSRTMVRAIALLPLIAFHLVASQAYGGGSGSSTASPTGAPTGGSTAAPTGGSTAAPTGGSTAAPTGGSTAAPTGGSTAAPTGGSTAAPTGGPTTTAAYISEKQKVIEILEAIETGDPNDPAFSFINQSFFIQHNLGDPPGFAGVRDFVILLNGTAQTDTVRIGQDGDIVFAHSIYNVFGPKMGFDVFRFENGLMVEHWDNLQTTVPGPNPSGHNMSDGPTQITDEALTASNRQLVTDYVNQVLIGGDKSKQASFFDGNNLIQHDPNMADGVTGLNAGEAAWAAAGNAQNYTFLFRVLCEGNFALAQTSGTLGGVTTAFYDLYRVANGKIAEHWDVIQAIPPQAQWANPNGKFICPGACVACC